MAKKQKTNKKAEAEKAGRIVFLRGFEEKLRQAEILPDPGAQFIAFADLRKTLEEEAARCNKNATAAVDKSFRARFFSLNAAQMAVGFSLAAVTGMPFLVVLCIPGTFATLPFSNRAEAKKIKEVISGNKEYFILLRNEAMQLNEKIGIIVEKDMLRLSRSEYFDKICAAHPFVREHFNAQAAAAQEKPAQKKPAPPSPPFLPD